ncbi:enoyl-CoA hydratase/isomerase family protein [Streptomyces lasiicapitis]|uniref:enoyl-CoA hydratase/isomerase family protein n=1 Tax=Streptomyces lasiicapitis TaxID=1923961 RepID=UPI003695CAA6
MFALPEAQLGVSVDAGGDLRVAREAGAGWAKFLALTGRRIDAPTAERLHLVQLVVPRPDLEATSRTAATEIATNAPLAVRASQSHQRPPRRTRHQTQHRHLRRREPRPGTRPRRDVGGDHTDFGGRGGGGRGQGGGAGGGVRGKVRAAALHQPSR